MRGAARLLCVSLCVALAAWTPGARAQAEDGLGEVTNLPVPRYVSLRSSEINVRRGPGLDYRKDWVFHRAGLPVRIIEEYGDWRRIVDKDDAGGWVYHAMLTGRRTVQVTAEEVVLREDPSEAAAPVARAEQGVVARLEACQPDWCEVEAEGHAGWVPKSAIWGVDPGEVVEP
jgi:SH3-like domain-containing protein